MVWGDQFGSASIKIGFHFPYPIKVWLNGHEGAKRQATMAGIGWTPSVNGIASCDDPVVLQRICDLPGPVEIQRLFDRWTAGMQQPLAPAARAAGYWWELSMRQIEVSRTMVFDAPPSGRAFFEALVANNLDLGRRRAD